MKLSGQVAIVTGAAGGIGRASVLTFAHEGAKVTAVDVSVVGGAETLALARVRGSEVIFEQADVRDEGQVKAMVDRTVARWGRLDILFNNAGLILVKPLEETTEAEWDNLMSVNLKAMFFGCKHVIPHMRRTGGGTILNMGSIGSFTGQLNTPAYIASKGAVALFTKSLALDYGRDGIRVNCICPGIVDTPIHAQDAEVRKLAPEIVPLGRMGTAEEIAQAAWFLLSDSSNWTTGTILTIDGGSSL